MMWQILVTLMAALVAVIAAFQAAKAAQAATLKRRELEELREAVSVHQLMIEKTQAMQKKLASRLNLREYRDGQDAEKNEAVPDWRDDPEKYIAQVSKQRGLIHGVQL